MKNSNPPSNSGKEGKRSLSPFSKKFIWLGSLVMFGLSLQLGGPARSLMNEVADQPANQPNQRSITSLAEAIAQSPLSFEANNGQLAEPVKYLSRGSGYSLFLTADEAVLALQPGVRQRPARSPKQILDNQATTQTRIAAGPADVLKMKLVGGRKDASIAAKDLLTSKSNYFIGSDSAQWRVNVPHYSQVQ